MKGDARDGEGPSPEGPNCPLPLGGGGLVRMAHGGGGRATHQLIAEIFAPAFANPALETECDGAVLPRSPGRPVFTTDSYVVRPLFFPGGDIGELAIYGTVNDLAMCGARPRYLSAGFILEEGLPLESLSRIARSMGAAARRSGVAIVTGDTKVVERGSGDGVFINTAGIGELIGDEPCAPARIRVGDHVLVSGDLGRHGIAILSARESLGFDSPPESDLAPLASLVEGLLTAGVDLHCARDLTRGGLAAALNEIAASAGRSIAIEEAALPICDAVEGACELLGLDPLQVANEGRFVAFVPPAQGERALTVLRADPLGQGARCIGVVEAGPGAAAPVVMTTRMGVRRVVDLPLGELLPRIC